MSQMTGRDAKLPVSRQAPAPRRPHTAQTQSTQASSSPKHDSSPTKQRSDFCQRGMSSRASLSRCLGKGHARKQQLLAMANQSRDKVSSGFKYTEVKQVKDQVLFRSPSCKPRTAKIHGPTSYVFNRDITRAWVNG